MTTARRHGDDSSHNYHKVSTDTRCSPCDRV
nr:MAG TPA: hypothetical protein [Caudoviricetes sp.]